MSGYVNPLDHYRELELFRQGFNPTPEADKELIEHIDKMAQERRDYEAKFRARQKAKALSKVLCPKCFQHIEIVRNYHRTNMLYNCNHCGAVLTKWEIFGTMAKDA